MDRTQGVDCDHEAGSDTDGNKHALCGWVCLGCPHVAANCQDQHERAHELGRKSAIIQYTSVVIATAVCSSSSSRDRRSGSRRAQGVERATNARRTR